MWGQHGIKSDYDLLQDKWWKKRKKAFVLFICIMIVLVTRMVRVEDKTTVKVHNMHTEQNEKAIRYVASNMIKEDPKIAITFDDGPSPAWTPQSFWMD